MARWISRLVTLACLAGCVSWNGTLAAAPRQAQPSPAKEAAPLRDEIAAKDRVQPADLAKSLQQSATPLILQVGPRTFFDQAHIVGAEYVGATGTEVGLRALRDRLADVGKDRWIVLYCGCCPWDRCPNIRPAFNQLRALGYSHVQALFLPNNFGADWVDKGYPTEK